MINEAKKINNCFSCCVRNRNIQTSCILASRPFNIQDKNIQKCHLAPSVVGLLKSVSDQTTF